VYWLARCEGFHLRCNDGTNGVVEEVLLDASNTHAQALVVRVGRVRHRSVVVPTERVDAVAPFEEVLLGTEVFRKRHRMRRRRSRPAGHFARKAGAAGGRRTVALLRPPLRSARLLLVLVARGTRVLVPRLARAAGRGAVAGAASIRAARVRATPRLAAATRAAWRQARLGVAAVAVVSVAAGRRLAVALRAEAHRLSRRATSRRR
jgi:hypothetical protein